MQKRFICGRGDVICVQVAGTRIVDEFGFDGQGGSTPGQAVASLTGEFDERYDVKVVVLRGVDETEIEELDEQIDQWMIDREFDLYDGSDERKLAFAAEQVEIEQFAAKYAENLFDETTVIKPWSAPADTFENGEAEEAQGEEDFIEKLFELEAKYPPLVGWRNFSPPDEPGERGLGDINLNGVHLTSETRDRLGTSSAEGAPVLGLGRKLQTLGRELSRASEKLGQLRSQRVYEYFYDEYKRYHWDDDRKLSDRGMYRLMTMYSEHLITPRERKLAKEVRRLQEQRKSLHCRLNGQGHHFCWFNLDPILLIEQEREQESPAEFADDDASAMPMSIGLRREVRIREFDDLRRDSTERTHGNYLPTLRDHGGRQSRAADRLAWISEISRVYDWDGVTYFDDYVHPYERKFAREIDAEYAGQLRSHLGFESDLDDEVDYLDWWDEQFSEEFALQWFGDQIGFSDSDLDDDGEYLLSDFDLDEDEVPLWDLMPDEGDTSDDEIEAILDESHDPDCPICLAGVSHADPRAAEIYRRVEAGEKVTQEEILRTMAA